MTPTPPPALQRTRRERRGCNHRVLRTGDAEHGSRLPRPMTRTFFIIVLFPANNFPVQGKSLLTSAPTGELSLRRRGDTQ